MLPYLIFTMNLIINLMNIPQYNEVVFIFLSLEYMTLPSTWVNSTLGVHFLHKWGTAYYCLSL